MATLLASQADRGLSAARLALVKVGAWQPRRENRSLFPGVGVDYSARPLAAAMRVRSLFPLRR